MDGIPDGDKLVLQKVRGVWYGQLRACVNGPDKDAFDFDQDLDLGTAQEDEHLVAAESDDATQLAQVLVRSWSSSPNIGRRELARTCPSRASLWKVRLQMSPCALSAE